MLNKGERCQAERGPFSLAGTEGFAQAARRLAEVQAAQPCCWGLKAAGYPEGALFTGEATGVFSPWIFISQSLHIFQKEKNKYLFSQWKRATFDICCPENLKMLAKEKYFFFKYNPTKSLFGTRQKWLFNRIKKKWGPSKINKERLNPVKRNMFSETLRSSKET